MMRTPAALALALSLSPLAACGGEVSGLFDAGAVDGSVDAEVDAPPGPCGDALALAGSYLDWDSTNSSFHGVGGAEWKVVVPADGPTATSAADGHVELCIGRNVTTQIDVTQASYLPARFVADGPVFNAPGVTFAVRGLAVGTGPAQLGELGESFNAAAAQILVYKVGAPIPLALQPQTNPPQRSYVSDGPDDAIWAQGDTGTLTFFPNRPVFGDSVTLTSTSSFVGPASLPLAAGRFTIVVIR